MRRAQLVHCDRPRHSGSQRIRVQVRGATVTCSFARSASIFCFALETRREASSTLIRRCYRGQGTALKPHNGLGRPLGLELWTLRRDVTPLSTLIAYHSQYGARAPTNESMRFASAAMHARVELILEYRDERDQSCALDLGDVAHLFGAAAGCVVRPITIIAPAHRPAFPRAVIGAGKNAWGYFLGSVHSRAK